MADARLALLLELVHVLAAAAWVGAAAVGQFLVGPVLRGATPGTRREFGGRYLPAAARLGMALGLLTLASGLLLAWVVDGSLRFEGDRGRLLAFGVVANLFALYLLAFAVRPTLRRIGQLAAEQDPSLPPSAQSRFLQNRLVWNGWMIIVLLLLALAAMVWADALGV